MFSSMFMSSRFSSYGRRDDSSDDEERTSAGFTLRQEGAGAAGGNAALQTALDAADPSAGRIALETEVEDGMDMDAAVAETIKHLCIECRDQPAMMTCDQCADRFCDVCFAAMHKRGTRAAHTHTPYTGGQQIAAIQALALAATAADPAAKPAAAAAGEVPGSMDDEEEKESKAHSIGSPEQVAPSSSSSAAAAAAAPSAAASSASPASPSADDDEVSDDLMLAQYQKANGAAAAAGPRGSHAGGASDGDDSDEDDNRSAASGASGASSRSRGIVLPSNAMNSSLVSGGAGDAAAAAAGGVPRLLANGLPIDWFSNRARYIPLRLTLEERKFLRLLEATLNVSEYTDKIDIVSNKDKMTRIKEQLRDLCSILSGLVVANDYKLGQKLIKDKEFSDNAAFFGNVFELGRRHKIRNPEKMRNTYGKLTYIIQDSVNPAISELMGFDLYAPLKTVYRELEAAGALDCLTDERLMIATGDIKTEGRQRPEIERDIKQKENAVTYLARRYMNDKINEEKMRACILSIADNHTFLIQNRHCCDTMLQWLTELYPSTEARTPAHSLAILGGRAGARLTHSHANQFAYVMQSLTLWREILHDMFRLWVCTEEDLFDDTNPYRLRNTGQGLNRVQSAPRVGKSMHNILYHCQRKLGSWVGSSVIHLGDHNVPNALSFIDKYTQVSRILNPIVLTIKAIPRLCEKKDVKFYIDSVFGGADALKMLILTDFFRHGFDGSGADNFFDAGSCIDGRLTSAWNWCNKLEKKSYYTIFQLSGFSSFDGQWQD